MNKWTDVISAIGRIALAAGPGARVDWGIPEIARAAWEDGSGNFAVHPPGGPAAEDPAWVSRQARALRRTAAMLHDAAVQVLGRLADIGKAEEVAPALTALLDHPDWDLRVAAAYSLRRVGAGAAGAVPRLLTLLEEVTDADRRLVAKTIGAIGPGARDALPALRALAADQRASESLRRGQTHLRGRVTAREEHASAAEEEEERETSEGPTDPSGEHRPG